MRSKLKNNKGMSLVEILVSMAIVGIMIMPVSSMVNTAIKTNKRSEVRQQGMLIGQEILEEIELLGDVETYKNNISKTKISLPSGHNMTRDNTGNDLLKYSMKRGIYKAEKLIDEYLVFVELEKNNSIEYDYDKNYIDPALRLGLELNLETDNLSNMIVIKDGLSEQEIAPIEVDGKKNIKLNIIEKNGIKIMELEGSNGLKTFNFTNTDINNLKLNLTENYQSEEPLYINVYNNSNSSIELYIQKSFKCKKGIYPNNKQGSIKIVNNVRDKEEIEDKKMNDFYNIKVIVKNKDKELFVGYGNRNLKINEGDGGE